MKKLFPHSLIFSAVQSILTLISTKWLKLLVLVFTVISFQASAQNSIDSVAQFKENAQMQVRSISALVGVSGFKQPYGEIGFSIHQFGTQGHHPTAWACFLSSEVKLGKELVVGPKVGGWIAGGNGAMALGINTICYTDFSTLAWRFRPEIGLGMQGWKIVYGYNVAINNKDFFGVQKHIISAVVLINLLDVNSFKK